MSGATGLDAQLGYAEETTYGTYVAPSREIVFLDESLTLDMKTVESQGIGTGQRFERTDQWVRGKRQVSGDIHAEVSSKGFGLFFKHLLGAVSTTADGAGKKHSFTAANLFGKSLSIQVGRPDVGNTVDPFSYVGCKITKGSFKQQVEGFLEMTLSIDGRDEDTSKTLAAVSVPTAEHFDWNTLAVTLSGSPLNVTDLEFDIENPMNTDRFFLAASNLKKEPLENARRKFSGKLMLEDEGLTNYQHFVNGDIVPIVFTWTGLTTYDTGNYRLIITLPNCRFDGTTPNVKGPDIVPQELPFVALDDGISAPVTLDYYTSDAAP